MSDELFNPDAVRNPSSGLFGRNPTHIEIAETAKDQSAIAKAIKDTGVKEMTLVHEYENLDKSAPPPFAGILKIRDMKEDDAVELCKNLARSRANIFNIVIKLGDYPEKQQLNNKKVQLLSSKEPRFHTEVGLRLGEILSDPTMNAVEIHYMVHNAESGAYNATAIVYGVSEEAYKDDKYFKPTIGLKYIKTA